LKKAKVLEVRNSLKCEVYLQVCCLHIYTTIPHGHVQIMSYPQGNSCEIMD